ncbi:hypothetical protein CC1G_09800 [Coprinopsis cinerea okayama7|uniref:Microtubule associated protein n=1 Tax=Coprinopsis cinerea (strain Okayama-7 / 130 / ATCC MYA-4618 / FGSC 9003) TaxID=240176 RepID=A8NM99_COPC7|nr:hypothetical protein CC1G_09800 [Coprinopsis cinerea okayama7\|eukprot:XP_001834873.2 hypothetical protein CC1G_09800 [Coprinopsis cinerea okayama7\
MNVRDVWQPWLTASPDKGGCAGPFAGTCPLGATREDELKDLQEQLIQGVERQIDLRRRQVDEWMAKCEAVETVCLRYTKALGGNTKSTGMTLGELRKEQSLPRRFDLVSEYQEKLRQAYHTKLEQLTTLTNRLNILARTLGTTYFAPDILEPTPAPALNEDDLDALDSTAPRDVTPERFLKLEKELVRGKAEVTKRLHQLSSIFAHIDWLRTELGMSEYLDSDDLCPTYSSFAVGAAASHKLASSMNPGDNSDPFLSTPTPASRGSSVPPLLFQELTTNAASSSTECESTSAYQRIFANFVARIEEADEEALQSNPSIPIGLENVEPTLSLIDWAQAIQASLEEVKRKREAHIQAMYDQLEGLWRRLGVEEEDMDAFVDMHRGSTEEVVRQYEEELERMLELKRERMGQFVESAREEIVQLWNDLMVGEEERADFAPFVDDEFTEELLTIHEDEIRRLREERRMKAPLLASIKKYFQICEEEKELAAAASDQTRLLGRGRDPGRLLREEKMRKRVQKEKPRLEQDLLASLPAWEQETGQPFLVYGESMLAALMETISQAQQENANKRSKSRSGSVPRRAVTPDASNSTSTGYVPGGSRPRSGTVTPAVRPRSAMASTSSSTSSASNKRQRLGDSTSRPGNLRASSPSKIPTKTPHHALGHGRIPSSVQSTAPRTTRSTSGTVGRSVPSTTMAAMASKRFPSASHTMGAGSLAGSVYGGNLPVPLPAVKRKSERGSFKPRPSLDRVEMKMGAFAGFGTAVREEEED